MKAATQVFERVMLFGVGVVIFIACYSIFIGYQAHFIEVSLEDQLDEVGVHITTNIMKAIRKENRTEARISIKIPQRVGNEPYYIRLSREGLNITTAVTGQNRFFNLYGIKESFSLGGETIISTEVSELLIYKKGNRIILL